MSVRLYELAAQYRALESLESSDELPAEVIRDTLEALEGDLHDKCTAVAMFGANLEAAAETIESAAAKMTERANRLRKRSESLNAYLLVNMQACGITKIQCPYFTLARKANPPAVIIDHEASIPDCFWKQPESPPKVIDKKMIAKAIKDGQEVPGAHTATGERLEVKV